MISSIIIPTFNRAQSLLITLESLVHQSLSPEKYEIIVIDNGSTDQTKNITQAVIAANSKYNIRYFYESVPGLLSGRHRGALEAKSELLIFVDDDIEVDYGWLAAIVETFNDPAVQLVGGKNLAKYEVAPPKWLEGFWKRTPYGGRACIYLSLLDLGDQKLNINANYIWGLNFAIRKQSLLDLGGFHPDNVPEHLQHFQGDGESGLTMKANQRGYRSVYQPQALVYHRIPKERLTQEYFKKRAFYQGVADSYTAIRRQCNCVSRLFYHGRNFAKWLLNKVETPELIQIKQQVQTAYQAGYVFHQNAVRQNPDLLKWVLQKDYWNYQLTSLKKEC